MPNKKNNPPENQSEPVKNPKIKKKTTKPQRSKLQIDLEDDEMFEMHLKGRPLREIAKKFNVSHVLVKNRIDKALAALGKAAEPEKRIKVKRLIRECELVKKRAWEKAEKNPRSDFGFKYLEIILKANQEIARLENLYPKEGEGEKKLSLNDLIDQAWNERKENEAWESTSK